MSSYQQCRRAPILLFPISNYQSVLNHQQNKAIIPLPSFPPFPPFLPAFYYSIIINESNIYNTDQETLMLKFSRRFFFSLQKFDPKKDYYRMLNLSENATQEQIKRSFRQFAKKYHPDSNKGNEEMFKEINEAHQVLSSEEIRKEYDASRKPSPSINQQSNAYQSPRQRQHEQPYRQQRRPYQQPYEEYDEQNPQKFREYLRKRHEEDMKKYTQQRHNYDNLGRGYDNYQRFREQTLQKKRQNFQQKVKITQESIRKEEQAYRKAAQQRYEQYKSKLKEQFKEDLAFRFKRGLQNGEKTLEGIKSMATVLKDFFTKK